MAEPPGPPPPQLTESPLLPMMYYTLVIVATVAGLVALYNFILIKCGMHTPPDRSRFDPLAAFAARPPYDHRGACAISVSSFEYKKGGGGGDGECAVCLSGFEDGEVLRRLPNCGHSFHAACIDMWLYSHSNCPLCRSPVVTTTTARAERSPEVFVGAVFV